MAADTIREKKGRPQEGEHRPPESAVPHPKATTPSWTPLLARVILLAVFFSIRKVLQFRAGATTPSKSAKLLADPPSSTRGVQQIRAGAGRSLMLPYILHSPALDYWPHLATKGLFGTVLITGGCNGRAGNLPFLG